MSILDFSQISTDLGYSRGYVRSNKIPDDLKPLIDPLIQAAEDFKYMAICHAAHKKMWKPKTNSEGFVVMEFMAVGTDGYSLNATFMSGVSRVDFFINDVDLSRYYEKYLKLKSLWVELSEADKVGLFSKLTDEITLSQVCEALERKQTVELWRIGKKYTLKIKNGATISGNTVIENNDSFILCGTVNFQHVFEFNKL